LWNIASRSEKLELVGKPGHSEFFYGLWIFPASVKSLHQIQSWFNSTGCGSVPVTVVCVSVCLYLSLCVCVCFYSRLTASSAKCWLSIWLNTRMNPTKLLRRSDCHLVTSRLICKFSSLIHPFSVKCLITPILKPPQIDVSYYFTFGIRLQLWLIPSLLLLLSLHCSVFNFTDFICFSVVQKCTFKF